MNYAGYKSNYAAGDYYRRSYAAGGLFGFIGKALGVAGKILPGPLGTVAKLGSGVLGGTKAPGTALAPIPAPSYLPPLGVPRGTPGATPKPGARGALERFLPGGSSGYVGGAGGAPAGWHWNKSYSYAKGLPAGSFLTRNRALNPTNPRALRRSVRRQQQFVAVARRVLKGTGMTIKRSGLGGKRKSARR